MSRKKQQEAARLRDAARKALLAGKPKKALEALIELAKLEPDDPRLWLKIADVRLKSGDREGAIQDYLRAAERYAEDGFAVQAIAIYKIVLRIDPSRDEIKRKLSALSSERGDDWAITTITSAEGAQGKRSVRIERTPLLSGLSGKELEDFIDSLSLSHYQAGECIYEAGSEGDALYLIGMGKVRLEAKDATGKKRVFARLGEGDFFGERAFMAKSKHLDDAIAETDAEILRIDRATFDAWTQKHPKIRDVVEEFYRKRVLERLLAVSPLFSELSEEERAQLAQRFRLRSFRTGEAIVQEGERGDAFYLIRSGYVRVFASDVRDPNKKVDLGEMREGDFFGEVALLTDRPRTATVVAVGEVEVMELARKDFEDLVRKHPSVREIVQRALKKRVRETISAIARSSSTR